MILEETIEDNPSDEVSVEFESIIHYQLTDPTDLPLD